MIHSHNWFLLSIHKKIAPNLSRIPQHPFVSPFLFPHFRYPSAQILWLCLLFTNRLQRSSGGSHQALAVRIRSSLQRNQKWFHSTNTHSFTMSIKHSALALGNQILQCKRKTDWDFTVVWLSSGTTGWWDGELLSAQTVSRGILRNTANAISSSICLWLMAWQAQCKARI